MKIECKLIIINELRQNSSVKMMCSILRIIVLVAYLSSHHEKAIKRYNELA